MSGRGGGPGKDSRPGKEPTPHNTPNIYPSLLSPVSLAFLGYRDYDDADRFVTVDFTENIDHVRNAILPIVANGGGDSAEDVAGGLDRVLKLGWTDAEDGVKVILFVADAPPHGRVFHDVVYSDNHPKGDKFGLDPLALVQAMARRRIDLTILKVHEHDTDTMIRLFAEAHAQGAAMEGGAGADANFIVTDLTPQLRAIRAEGGGCGGGGGLLRGVPGRDVGGPRRVMTKGGSGPPPGSSMRAMAGTPMPLRAARGSAPGLPMMMMMHAPGGPAPPPPEAYSDGAGFDIEGPSAAPAAAASAFGGLEGMASSAMSEAVMTSVTRSVASVMRRTPRAPETKKA